MGAQNLNFLYLRLKKWVRICAPLRISLPRPCNCNATEMQLQCNLIPIQADNFDFWDKGTEKKKKKISDC